MLFETVKPTSGATFGSEAELSDVQILFRSVRGSLQILEIYANVSSTFPVVKEKVLKEAAPVPDFFDFLENTQTEAEVITSIQFKSFSIGQQIKEIVCKGAVIYDQVEAWLNEYFAKSSGTSDGRETMTLVPKVSITYRDFLFTVDRLKNNKPVDLKENKIPSLQVLNIETLWPVAATLNITEAAIINRMKKRAEKGEDSRKIICLEFPEEGYTPVFSFVSLVKVAQGFDASPLYIQGKKKAVPQAEVIEDFLDVFKQEGILVQSSQDKMWEWAGEYKEMSTRLFTLVSPNYILNKEKYEELATKVDQFNEEMAADLEAFFYPEDVEVSGDELDSLLNEIEPEAAKPVKKGSKKTAEEAAEGIA